MTCFVYEANQSSSILLYKISINLIVSSDHLDHLFANAGCVGSMSFSSMSCNFSRSHLSFGYLVSCVFCCFNMYLRRASGWIGRVKVGSLKTH